MAGQSMTREPGGRKWSQPCDLYQMHTHTLLGAHYPWPLPWCAALVCSYSCWGSCQTWHGPIPFPEVSFGQGQPLPEGPVRSSGGSMSYTPATARVIHRDWWDPAQARVRAVDGQGWKYWVGVITENICIVYQATKIMGFKGHIHGVQPASSCLRQPAAWTGKSWPQDKRGRRSCSW